MDFGFSYLGCKDALLQVINHLAFHPSVCCHSNIFIVRNVWCMCTLVPDLLETCLCGQEIRFLQQKFNCQQGFLSKLGNSFTWPLQDPSSLRMNGLRETHQLQQFPPELSYFATNKNVCQQNNLIYDGVA